MENFSSFRAHKWFMLTLTPMPTTPNFNCNSQPVLIKNLKAGQKDEYIGLNYIFNIYFSNFK